MSGNVIRGWKATFVLQIIAASLLSGCAFKRQAAGMAVDYNDFVAQTTNRQTVLNVLRAREREPMHFTSFSEVFGQVRGTGSASVGGAWNGDGSSRTSTTTKAMEGDAAGALAGTSLTETVTDVASMGATNITPSIGVQITTGTDFRITANATDEFYRGILNPVPASTIVHFLRQGFPADLLSHLLVGRLEFSALVRKNGDAGETVLLHTINNNPDEAISAGEFAAAIRCRQLDYTMTATPAQSLPVESLSSLAPISADVLKRIEAVTDETTGGVRYAVVSPAQNEFGLAMSEPDRQECLHTRRLLSGKLDDWMKRNLAGKPKRSTSKATPEELDGIAPSAKNLPAVARSYSSDSRRDPERQELGRPGEFQFQSKDYFTNKMPEGYSGDLIIDLTLRSVQGVIYYLGEYVRKESTSPKLGGPPCAGIYCMPILRVLPIGDIDANARFVDVTYRGKRYAVPVSGRNLTAEAGRSSQTIDLVQQLLNLNRSSKDLPTTPLVRVAN